jgi:hypothetical protein
MNGMSVITKVEYFFQLWFGDIVHSLALVSIFSPLGQDLLELSHCTAYICHHSNSDVLTVLDVKAINMIIAMVLDYQVTVEGNCHQQVTVSVNRSFLKLESCPLHTGQISDKS